MLLISYFQNPVDPIYEATNAGLKTSKAAWEEWSQKPLDDLLNVNTFALPAHTGPQETAAQLETYIPYSGANKLL